MQFSLVLLSLLPSQAQESLSYNEAMASAGRTYFIVYIDCDPNTSNDGIQSKENFGIHYRLDGPWQGISGPAIVISRRGEWLETRKKIDGEWRTVWKANAAPSRPVNC